MTQSVVWSSAGEVGLCFAVQLVTTQVVVSSCVMSSCVVSFSRSRKQVSGLGLKLLHDILGREVLKRGDLAPIVAFVLLITTVSVVRC